MIKEMEKIKIILSNLYEDYLCDFERADALKNYHEKDRVNGSISIIRILNELIYDEEVATAEELKDVVDAEYKQFAFAVVEETASDKLITIYLGALSAIQNIRANIGGEVLK